MSRTDPNDTAVLVCTGLGLAIVAAGLLYVVQRDNAPPVTAVNAQTGLMSSSAALTTTGSVERIDAELSEIGRTFIAANEDAALDSLRAIVAAQTQVRESGAIDTDGDGVGEYAYLGELMGRATRTLDALEGEEEPPSFTVEPALLDPEFGTLTESARGIVLLRDGYAFQVHLPGPSDESDYDLYPGLPESGAAGVGGVGDEQLPDAVASAHAWVAYAWPLEHGRTGERAFFVDHDGVIAECANEAGLYAGLERVPRPDAALGSSDRGNLLAVPGWVSGSACDGQDWTVLSR